MHPIFGFWLIINAVSCYGIVIVSLIDSDTMKSNILFFPMLVRGLRESLSITGTVIATILISLFFLPAITLYYLVLAVIGVIYYLGKGFLYIFKRRDKDEL